MSCFAASVTVLLSSRVRFLLHHDLTSYSVAWYYILLSAYQIELNTLLACALSPLLVMKYR